MNFEDEIKQINEIINKLDIIQEDEWQIKEGETEEEYNERIEEIEEELEEELLDYISDSLLDEQKLNEEDAVKEAQEKIKKDYELFEDAFIKNEDGTITLKSDEELVELGYDNPDELEKLRDIEKNMNNSDQYLNAIRESIKASKDIDAEIDRKMELAKSIITAKKRGESLPSNLNPNLQKDKFEKANEYIASTTTLKRIPVIQNEYIKNNYIAERRYNNLTRNNNVNKSNTSNNRVVTSTATVNPTPVSNNVVLTANIVTKKIPDRKNVVYSNFEKKLDKDNDLTKQKIKARTELKLIFKEIENKELLGKDVEELKLKIENIKKKYPNTITDKALDRLYDKYNVQIKVNETEEQIQQAVENIEQEAQAEIEEIKQNIEGKLEDVESIEDAKVGNEKVENIQKQDDLQNSIYGGQFLDWGSPIDIEKRDSELKELAEPNDVDTEIAETKREIKKKSPSTKIKQKATDAALGALGVGAVVGTTLETLKKKSEEKIDDLKKKGEDLVENIVEQQKDVKRKKNAKAKKETTRETNKVKTPQIQAITNPIKKENSISEESQTEKATQIEEKSKNVSNNSKMSKEELMKALKNTEKYSTEDIHAKGIDSLIINKLILYLKENDDPEIQERLNKEIEKLQTDKHKKSNRLYIYGAEYCFPGTLKYMHECYKKGIKSSDGSREIIPANMNAASYYLYLAYNTMHSEKERKERSQSVINAWMERGNIEYAEKLRKELKEHKKIEKIWIDNTDFTKEVEEDFNINKEEICYRYFEYLKEKYNMDKLDEIERLKAESCFTNELIIAKRNSEINTEYLNLAINKEIISRIANDDKEFIKAIQAIETKNNSGEKMNLRILKLLGDTYFKGLRSSSDKEIVKQDKRKAKEIYEKIIDEKELPNDVEIYNNLFSIYNDNKSPLYDNHKAENLKKIANKKGVNIQREETIKGQNEKASVYVCSDLHGQYPAYQAIVKQLKDKDKLYILGDVIDRGPDGIKILQDIMKRKEKEQVEFLIGNHELMMIQSLFLNDEKAKNDWLIADNGGKETFEEFDKLNANEQNKIKEFFLNSFVYKNIDINSKKIHLVHAKSIQEKDESDSKTVREFISKAQIEQLRRAVWCRKDGLKEGERIAKNGTFTVIGHTPTHYNTIEYEDGYIDIDCGASYGHNAALVNLTKGTVKYIDAEYERKKGKNEKSR